jgi:putative membrane-bound dehydrogenase-like protein
MASFKLRRVAFATVAMAVTTISAYQSPPTGSWPPDVQKTVDAPMRSPSEALAMFSLPPGYRIELVASEPLIQDPIVIEWDVRQRLWAIELPGYMRNILAAGEYDPIGRIVVLEDTNRDGRMDRRTVFADGLVQPRALAVLEDSVLVGEPPNVWWLKDTDGDLRADSKTLAATGYGRRETNVEVNANGLYWSIDNRIYTSGTGADMYLRLRNGRIETHRSLSRGQWGLTQDDAGRIYRNHNESVLHADLVPTLYFARNPNLLRTRGSHERLIDADAEINAVWPARQTPGTNRAYQHGILREDGTLATFTAACAPTVYRGDRLPAELNGNVFVAEPAANLVSRLVVTDDGTTLRARKAYERAEFLTSADERFRPVYLSSAPDGTLYIVDMYRGIIQHRAYITEYLRDQIAARKLEQPIGLGRIYRVVHETTRRDREVNLSKASSMQLTEMLSHPNGWWREAAQRLLVERVHRVESKDPRTVEPAIVTALVDLASGARDWRARLHALWTLDGMDAIQPYVITKALDDVSREVRASALRIAERWLVERHPEILAAVMKRLSDRDWMVQQQLAASLGTLPVGVREEAIVALLERRGGDPIVMDAALSGLRGGELPALDKILERREQTLAREAAITMLAATMIRSGQESAVQDVFLWAADDARVRWQREAMLRAAEIALLGAAPPGTAARGPVLSERTVSGEAKGRGAARGTSAPCPTCPGGRAGPGGAYAFRTQEDVASSIIASGANRGDGPRLRMNREPFALSRWAASGDDLSPRVASVLERVTWPGKAGDAAPIPPLTTDQQKRFNAGQKIYQNICQACHQPDGRGQERLAPTLIGSALTLAEPGIPARILLNGKEGTTGLMPPVGAVLTDEEIASVLTYVRREWGQSAMPVDPETVRTVRALTVGRTRPWTDEELKGVK